uniref:HTH psq-type domain-containing protein n=1 Tax=Gopherus agassizii TaxID=38772 RepID=A0A452GRA7_9SAUR
MVPKCKAPTSSGAQPKKQRCIPTLEEKLVVLNLLRDGMSIANVAHKYSRNESSIHAIKIRETEIRQVVASSVPVTAKVTTPGFKAAKDSVTVLLCGNVAGHLIKPSLLYRAANPRALKGKNKNLLPVFWQ